MAKSDKEVPVTKLAPKVEEMPATGCVVCGSYQGELTGTAGHARWHADCEAKRPDVIAKVRARA